MNQVLTDISIVKGFVNIPLATLPDGSIAPKISSGVESVINLAWMVPVIMNIQENKDTWKKKYKSLIPESIGNIFFNCGGIMDFPIVLAKGTAGYPAACGVQYGAMVLYGIFMPIAGGINEFAH
ncbi:MAG TPA: hypothetical protein VGW57_00440 [Chthoniobacterales bacterium]|nr:hypothetical protein [Chthoniobacterales bacterium]